MSTPSIVIHTHDENCLVLGPTGSFVCIVTLLPVSVIGRSPFDSLSPAVYDSMAALRKLTPAQQLADYQTRYGAAVAAKLGTP